MFFRDLKWKLADRFPSLDRKSLYYRPERPERRGSGLSAYDRLLIGFLSLVLIGIGTGLLIFSAVVIWAFLAS